MMIGIIGGSGLYGSLKEIEGPDDIMVETPHGDVRVVLGFLGSAKIAFVSRHGDETRYPPHAVNHKANIMALEQLGVECIVATSAVGVLRFDYELGKLILADQLVDMTRSVHSFFNGGDEGIVHTDMSDPFCTQLLETIGKVLEELEIGVQYGGTYICLSGPTFETKAEIKMFQSLGMSFVGMTVGPECKLARELGMCYVPILLPVNYGAGMEDGMISHDTTLSMVELMVEDVARSLKEIVVSISTPRNCNCSKAPSKM